MSDCHLLLKLFARVAAVLGEGARIQQSGEPQARATDQSQCRFKCSKVALTSHNLQHDIFDMRAHEVVLKVVEFHRLAQKREGWVRLADEGSNISISHPVVWSERVWPPPRMRARDSLSLFPPRHAFAPRDYLVLGQASPIYAFRTQGLRLPPSSASASCKRINQSGQPGRAECYLVEKDGNVFFVQLETQTLEN